MLRNVFRPVLLVLAFALAVAVPVWAQAPVPVPPLVSPVVDITGTLNAAEITQLEQQALALQKSNGSQLQILIVPSTRPETIEAYAQRVFDTWKLGRQGVDDGVLLLVAKDDRTVRIQTGYGLESAIPDITAGRVIQEYLVPKFRRGDMAGGLNDATLVIASLMNGEALPAPMAAHVAPLAGARTVFALFLALCAAALGRLLTRDLASGWRIGLCAILSAAAAFALSASWPVLLLSVTIGLFIGAVTMPEAAVAAAGRHGQRTAWRIEDFLYDPNAPASVRRRAERDARARRSSDNDDWSSSSDSSSSSSGWSGGGGSSGGGGASGSW
jgi:uncharacterized protein